MRVCLIPRAVGGGPASFQGRLQTEMQRRNVETTFDPDSRNLDAVLVFAGTRNWRFLWHCRRRGVPVIHRLDGINWMHRVRSRGIRYALRAEALNGQLRLIRARLADRIVYQSAFIRDWWQRWYGQAAAPARVIHNGVPLDAYPPRSGAHDGTLLVVEGALHDNPPTRQILQQAHRDLVQSGRLRRLEILARVDNDWRKDLVSLDPPPEGIGLRPLSEVKKRQSAAALFLSMEINPPCPNAIIEALAAGLPVLAFDTGSARELIGAGGEVVPYAGDPWRLEIPRNLDAIGPAGRRILDRWREYSVRARSESESRFDIRTVGQAYMEALSP
jgi:glycosyltransferase involved in cell wall biosynthesis